MGRVSRWVVAAIILVTASLSCRDRVPLEQASNEASTPVPLPNASATTSVAPPAASGPAREAIATSAQLVPLAVTGHRDAVVSVPVDATSPRPLLVAVHGNYDRVESFCEIWKGITRGWAFVLCPRGVPRVEAGPKENRWTFGWNARDLEREVNAGVVALRARHGALVAAGPIVLAGFSLGAIQGADLVLWRPDLYPRAILVEGGTTNWSLLTSKGWRKRGGERLLFACGTAACPPETRVAENWLELAGVQAKTAYGGHVAHTCDGVVAEAIVANLPWLLAGDDRWLGLPTDRKSSRAQE